MTDQANACIQAPCQIWGESNLHFAGRAHIGRGTEIMADGGVWIGDNVVISFNCVLWSVDHRYEGESLPYDKARIRRPIRIGDNVWIGRNAIIRGGVTIGEGAVVAMGSVVTRDLPPLAVVGGNPARLLRYRDVRRYQTNVALGRSLWQEPGVCAACQSPDYFLLDAGENPLRQPSLLARVLNLLRYWGWRVAHKRQAS